MRGFLVLLLLHGTLSAADSRYPLWDGHETVEQYAARANLPATKTVDLGAGVKLELMLIPAGQFLMGTHLPIKDLVSSLRIQVHRGQVLVAFGGTTLLAMVLLIVMPAIWKRRRPNFSLARLLTMTVVAGVTVIGFQHYQKNVKPLENAEYELSAAFWPNSDIRLSEYPAHPVTLTTPFYMGKFVVTQEQYRIKMGHNPSNTKGNDYPIDHVSWNDAQEFCRKVSRESLQNVRLPSEAEWEFACRAGTTTQYYCGHFADQLDCVANYSDSNYLARTAPCSVGLFLPNNFGLYDMHGNVWQWCEDYYGREYYDVSPIENPLGPAVGSLRVLRGGSYASEASSCRAAFRGWNFPDTPNFNFGFRVVISAPPLKQ